MTPEDPEILYCRCAWAQVVPDATKQEVLEGLCKSGKPFRAVADLCEMAAQGDPGLSDLAAGKGSLRIAACYPRAVRGLFRQADAPLSEEVEIFNMREAGAEEILQGVLAEKGGEVDR